MLGGKKCFNANESPPNKWISFSSVYYILFLLFVVNACRAYLEQIIIQLRPDGLSLSIYTETKCGKDMKSVKSMSTFIS